MKDTIYLHTSGRIDRDSIFCDTNFNGMEMSARMDHLRILSIMNCFNIQFSFDTLFVLSRPNRSAICILLREQRI